MRRILPARWGRAASVAAFLALSAGRLPCEAALRTAVPGGPGSALCSRLYDVPAAFGVSTTTVHHWFECIRSTNTADRRLAVSASAPLIAKFPDVLIAVRKATADPDPWVRDSAILFFIEQGRPYADGARREILAGLSDSDVGVRDFAAQVVGTLGWDSRRGVARMLSSAGADSRTRAIVLAYAGHPDQETARVLASGLDDHHDENQGDYELGKLTDWRRRTRTVNAIIALGPKAAPAREILVSLLDAPDKGVQCDAMHALAGARIAPRDLLGRMMEREKRDDCPVQAAEVLGAIGPAAASAIPALLEKIKGAPGMCCDQYAEIVANMGPVSIPALLAVSEEGDPYRSTWAAAALTRFAGIDDRASRRIIRALDEKGEAEFRVRRRLESQPESVRAFAKVLYGRVLKNHPLWLDQDDIRTLSTIFPSRPDDLYSPSTNHEMEFKLDAEQSGPGNDIAVTLTARNASGHAVRLTRPDCDPFRPDPVDFIIIQQPGWPVFPIPHSPDRESSVRDEDTSVVLAPKGERRFSCRIRSSAIPTDHFGSRFLVWGYDYPGNGGESRSSPNQLRPGRYWIQARYRSSPADNETYSSPSEDFARKNTPIWVGEVYSNRIELDVK